MKPNIIIILLDDMGWRDLGCFGSTFYETPHIDRLAEEGMIFRNAYASCPVCSPSRASLLTGKYPARIGITNWIGAHDRGKLLEVPYLDHLPHSEISLPKKLKEGGYATWHIGKWHLGKKEFYPEYHGFDVNIGGCSWGCPHKGYFAPWGIETLPEGEDEEYLTDRLTDEAIRLIRNREERPFFMFFSHYAVHAPIQAKKEDIERFEKKYKRMKLDQIDPFVKGENFPCEHKRSEHVIRRIVQSDVTYAAMIYNLDQSVGRLVQELKDQGIYENTVILFTSDNGGLSTAEGSPTSNLPLSEGKGWMYDGGVREPMIVKATGLVQPGSICSVPVTTPDIYPTILELAGLPLMPDQHMDGESMLPLLKGETQLKRDAIYWHYPHYGNQGGTPAAAVRSGDYKLIKFFEDMHLELYNLEEDISENFNLAKSLPEKALELEEKLDNWLIEVNGIIPKPNPDWQL